MATQIRQNIFPEEHTHADRDWHRRYVCLECGTHFYRHHIGYDICENCGESSWKSRIMKWTPTKCKVQVKAPWYVYPTKTRIVSKVVPHWDIKESKS